jgi:hypothetical protein
MNESDLIPGGRGRAHYRLVVEGELGQEWASWFGADSAAAGDNLTAIELYAADQADLHGLLRRVADMNLRILELVRVDGEVKRPIDTSSETEPGEAR